MPEKPKVGDIRPVFQQVGFEVCKKTADKEEDREWIPCEKQAEAEILSQILKEKIKE